MPVREGEGVPGASLNGRSPVGCPAQERVRRGDLSVSDVFDLRREMTCHL